MENLLVNESDIKKKGYNILHGCPSWSKETDLSSVVRKHAWVRTPYGLQKYLVRTLDFFKYRCIFI